MDKDTIEQIAAEVVTRLPYLGVHTLPSAALFANAAQRKGMGAEASPSMMHERERSRTSASTISGKRWMRSLPGRL
jgi:hypothetical protein